MPNNCLAIPVNCAEMRIMSELANPASVFAPVARKVQGRVMMRRWLSWLQHTVWPVSIVLTLMMLWAIRGGLSIVAALWMTWALWKVGGLWFLMAVNFGFIVPMRGGKSCVWKRKNEFGATQ